MASLAPGREHPAVLSAAVGGDWSRPRIVMVGRQGLQRRAFLSLSGRRCQDMLTDPHRPSPSPHRPHPTRSPAPSCSRSSSPPMLTWARLLSVPRRRVNPNRTGDPQSRLFSNYWARYTRMKLRRLCLSAHRILRIQREDLLAGTRVNCLYGLQLN